jgi:hypothetical protein
MIYWGNAGWRVFLASAAVGLLTSCASAVDVQALNPKPPTIMVAKKMDVPLYIVLDPARVKPEYAAPRIDKLLNMQSFVTRDLTRVMGEYFSEVKVVASANEAPKGRTVIADVKVDEFKSESVILSGTGYTVLVMTWSFAVRPSESEDYLFSFAGIAKSHPNQKSWDGAVTNLLENALTGLLDEWASAGAANALKAWSTAAPAATD